MKKILTILVIALAMIVFSTPVMAWDPPYSTASYGTDYAAGSNYQAGLNNGGLGTAEGDAFATVYAPQGTSVFGNGLDAGSASSSQAVDSNAVGYISTGWVSTEAYGEAAQFSSAYVNYDNLNWADGGQSSDANYLAQHTGLTNSSVSGSAETSGSTAVAAVNYDSGNSNIGTASATTSSEGTATADGYGGFTSTLQTVGSGNVTHVSGASQGVGIAWSDGTASYSYDTNNGYGGAHAITDGTSTVTSYNNGAMTASSSGHSASGTYSGAFTSGSTHISSF